MKNKVNVLGTQFHIYHKNYDCDIEFKKGGCDGYCDLMEKIIVVGKLKSFPAYEDRGETYCKRAEMETLRHEIVHAFFIESGLDSSAMCYEGAWARCEEMVDWFALQGPKIYKAWQEAGAL